MIRKIRFSKGFAKQEMTKRAIIENLEVFELLKDKETLDDKSKTKLATRVFNMTNDSLKDIDLQFKSFVRAKGKVLSLKYIQKKRRAKLQLWFNSYLSEIEDVELTKIVDKMAFGLDEKYKKALTQGARLSEEHEFYNIEDRKAEDVEKIIEKDDQEREEMTPETSRDDVDGAEEDTSTEGDTTLLAEDTQCPSEQDSEEDCEQKESGSCENAQSADEQDKQEKEKNDFRAFFAKGEDCGESSCSCKDKAENS